MFYLLNFLSLGITELWGSNWFEDYHDIGTDKFQKWMMFLMYALYIILKEKNIEDCLCGLADC